MLLTFFIITICVTSSNNITPQMIPNKIVDKVVAGIHRQEWLEGDVAVVAVLTRNINNDNDVSYSLSDMILTYYSSTIIFTNTSYCCCLYSYPPSTCTIAVPPEYIYQLFC